MSVRSHLGALAVVLFGCATPPSKPAQKAAPPEPQGRAIVAATAPELIDRIKGLGAQAVIVNIWATWCDPCKEELPDFLMLEKKYAPRGVRLLLVSADADTERPAVEAFLEEMHVDFPTYVKKGGDMDFINTLEPRWSGALPATLIYGPGGKETHFVEGRLTFDRLEKLVLDVLKSPS